MPSVVVGGEMEVMEVLMDKRGSSIVIVADGGKDQNVLLVWRRQRRWGVWRGTTSFCLTLYSRALSRTFAKFSYVLVS